MPANSRWDLIQRLNNLNDPAPRPQCVNKVSASTPHPHRLTGIYPGGPQLFSLGQCNPRHFPTCAGLLYKLPAIQNFFCCFSQPPQTSSWKYSYTRHRLAQILGASGKFSEVAHVHRIVTVLVAFVYLSTQTQPTAVFQPVCIPWSGSYWVQQRGRNGLFQSDFSRSPKQLQNLFHFS